MKSLRHILSIGFLFATCTPWLAGARAWIVAQDGTGDFSSVAAACEAAAAGDSILIRPGSYREEGHDDPMDPEILMTEKPLSILGDGPPGSIRLQMRLGFVNCDGVVLSNLHLHDTTSAITIWGRFPTYDARYLIQSCRFENNDARAAGGGAILVWGAIVTVEDSVFKGNVSHESFGDSAGGAIHSTAHMTVHRCVFQSNYAASRGGAVFAGSDLLIEDCLFLGNSSPHGAAVSIGSGRITRSTFYKNDCLGEIGGAIEIFSDHSNAIPDHCIIAETRGAAIECPMPASAMCCNVWMNQIGPDPNCAFDPDDGNFSADPLFCDPEGGDFGLLENSPCLPGNHGGHDCGRIGGGAEYCGIIRTQESTWGRLKMLWR